MFHRNRVSVLCYHSLSDLRGDPVLGDYGLPEGRFEQHLRTLRRLRCRFLSPDEFAAFLDGKAVPARSVLLTFDDAYADLARANAVLADHGIPSIAFAVSDLLGGSNRWDRAIGAAPLRLLSAEALRRLESDGMEIGSHGATHVSLPGIGPAMLAEEIGQSAARLAAAGLRQPRFFAYPYGEFDETCRRHVAAAGYVGAFSLRAGHVVPDGDRFAIPRFEVLDSAERTRFLACLLLAGRGVAVTLAIERTRRRALRLARAVCRRLGL